MMFAIDLVLLLVAAVALWRKDRLALCDFNKDATVPLRAILALFVVFTHVSIWSPLKLGTEAVSVFLFISGYGMYKSFELKGYGYLHRFVRKHFCRLFLPVALCSAAWVARMYLGNWLHGKGNYNGAFILNCLSTGNVDCLLPNSWFPIELLVLGILFAFSFRLGRGIWREIFVVLGCIFLYVISRYVIKWGGGGAWWWMTIWAFPVGVFYAKYEATIKRTVIVSRWRYPLCLAIGLAALNFIAMKEAVLAVTGCVVVLVLYVLPLPRWSWLIFLGGVSYEIYLTHGMVYNVLTQCGVYKGLATCITLAVTPVCAYVLHLLLSYVIGIKSRDR